MNTEILLERHLDSLWSVALRLTGDREEAEDLLQDTCLKAFENLKDLRSESKAKAWLMKILTNTFLNKKRKNRKIVEESFDPDYLEPIFYKNGTYIDFEGDIFSRVVEKEIKEAIESLPIDYRIVVVLVDVEGLTYKEVEEVTGISSGTISSRLYRGRRLLRDILLEYAKERGYLKEGKSEL